MEVDILGEGEGEREGEGDQSTIVGAIFYDIFGVGMLMMEMRCFPSPDGVEV